MTVTTLMSASTEYYISSSTLGNLTLRFLSEWDVLRQTVTAHCMTWKQRTHKLTITVKLVSD